VLAVKVTLQLELGISIRLVDSSKGQILEREWLGKGVGQKGSENTKLASISERMLNSREQSRAWLFSPSNVPPAFVMPPSSPLSVDFSVMSSNIR